MTNTPLQQLTHHPRRRWIVGGAAIMLALIVGLPALDEVNRLAEETSHLQGEIEALQSRVSNIDVLDKRISATKETFKSQQRTIGPDAALAMREEVVRQIHASKCRLLKVQLSDAITRPFAAGDDPMNQLEITDDDRPFVLVQTKLTLSAEGELGQLNSLTEKLQALHRLAIPTKMTMYRDGPRSALRLEVELTLIDLRPKSVEL